MLQRNRVRMEITFWAKTITDDLSREVPGLSVSPLLVAPPSNRAAVWSALLRRTGYAGTETEEQFDRVLEVAATDSGADMIEDAPVAFGAPIGERHAPRWIRRVPKS